MIADIFMSYNPLIHHRQSIRLKGFDYSSVGYYFITICCFQRLPCFGKIENGHMILNANGLIAQDEWLNTTNKRQNIELDAFVVMPNHMHGIIHITNNMQNSINSNKASFRSPSQTVGAMIRDYKSAVTSQLKQQIGHAVWQRNYYEHIIRDEKSHQNISDYITNNPYNWENDEYYI